MIELLQEQNRLRRASVGNVNNRGEGEEQQPRREEEDIESLQLAAQKRREERRRTNKNIANSNNDRHGGNGGRESKEQEGEKEEEEEVVDTIEVVAKSNNTLKMQENDIQELQYAAQKRREERHNRTNNKQKQRQSRASITASMTSENNGSEGGVNAATATGIRNEFVYQLSWFFHLLAYSEDILQETKNDFCVGDEIQMSDDEEEDGDESVEINEEGKEDIHVGGENDNEVAKGAIAGGAAGDEESNNPFEQLDKDMELEDENNAALESANNIDAMMAASGMMSASNSFFDQGLSLLRDNDQPPATTNNPFDQFDHPDNTTNTTEEDEYKKMDASSELTYLAVDSAAHESLAAIVMTLAASRSHDKEEEEEDENKAICKKSRSGKDIPSSSRRHKSRSDRSHSMRHSHRSSSSRQQRSSSRHSTKSHQQSSSSSRHSTKSHRLKRPKDMTPLQRAAIDAFMAKARNGQGSDDDWERLVKLMKDDDREGYEEALGMVISKQSDANGAEEVDGDGGGMPNQIIGGEGTGHCHHDDADKGSSGNIEKRNTSNEFVMGGNLGGSATLSSNPNNEFPKDAIDPTSFYQHLSSYTSSSSSQGASSYKRDSFSINTNNVGDAAMVFRCLVSALEHSVKCELERLNKILDIREIELWNEEGKDNGKGTTTAAVNNACGSSDDDGDGDDDANQQTPTAESDLQSALLQIQSSIQSSWSGTLMSRIVGTCSTVSYQATAEFSYDGTNVITKPTIITSTKTTMRTKKNGNLERPIPVPWPVPVIMQSWQLTQNEQKKQGAAKPQLDRRESQIPNGTKPYFKDLVQSIHSITITPNPIRGYDWRSLMKHNDGSDIVEQTFVKRVDGDGNQIPESKRGSLNDSLMSQSGHAGSVENTDGGTGGTAEDSGESKANGDIVPEGLSVGLDMTQDTSPDNVYVEAALDSEDEGPSRSIACQVDFGFDRGTQTTLDEDGNLVHTDNEQILEIREYIEEPEKEANEEEVEKEVSEANATEATAEESKDEESSSGNPRASPTDESTSSNNPNARIEKDSVYTAAVFALVSTPRVRRGGSVSSRRSASSRLRQQRVRREEQRSSDTSSANGMNQNDNEASASSSDARVCKAYDASPGIFSSGYTTPFGMEVGPSSPEETTTMSYAPSPSGSPALPLSSDSSSSDSEDTSVDSRVSSVDTDTSSDEDEEEDDNNVVQGLAQVQQQEAQRQHTYRGIFGDDHSSMTHSSAIETPENLDELSLGSFTDDSLSDGDEKKNEEYVDIRVRKLPHPENDGDEVVAPVGEEASAEQDSLDGRVNEAMDQLALESFSPTRKASENEADVATDNKQEMPLPDVGAEAEGETEDNPFAMPKQDDNKGPLDSYIKAASVGSTSYSAVSDSDEDSSSNDSSSSDNDSSTSSSNDSSDSSDSSTSTDSSSTSASSSDDSASFSSSQEEENAEEVAENSTDHDDRGDHYSATTSNYPHNETQEEWVTRKETRLVNPLPQNLTFHLKRFEYSSVLGRVEKLPGTMSVPEELDMKTFCLESLGVANESELPGQLCCYEYRLSGAIVHVDPIEEMKKDEQVYGETSEGHYVTFISSSAPSSKNSAAGTIDATTDPSTIPQDKQMNSTWTEIDDEFVRNVDSNEYPNDSLHPALKIINGCDVSNHDAKQTSESSSKRVVKEKERRYATLVVYSRACQCYQ